MNSKYPYIAIEGVIGAGKTSLADRLCRTFSAQLILEEFENNPFLEDFYREPRYYAFQTQIFFLLSRFRQQERLLQLDLFQTALISDYLFNKDRIFATQNLTEKEMVLYDGIARIMEREIIIPDLVIYLRASTGRLLANIRKRDRSYERSIDDTYIHELNILYDQFFAHYKKTNLLIVNTEDIDFVNYERDYSYIVKKVNEKIKTISSLQDS